MQVDIFLLQRGLESRTTCSQTFLQNVSVDSYSDWMHNFNTTAAEVQWTANSLLTFYITCQVLTLELCKFHEVVVHVTLLATRRKYYNVLYVQANILPEILEEERIAS